MQIQIRTDHNIEAHEALAKQVSGIVENALRRSSDHITQVEVHLSDVNSDKKGGNNDMRCLIEAHLEGRQPIAVSHQATTMEQAVEGAANKLARLLENTLDRLHDQERHPHESRRTDQHPSEPEPTTQP